MKTTVVVTSISAPNKALKIYADGCLAHGYDFIVIGDQSSPSDFKLDGCNFYDIEAQKKTGFLLARKCPERSYSRKNIAYLLAMRNRSDVILESDDDNIAFPEFWNPPVRKIITPVIQYYGWVNIYSLFSDKKIWPRGLPLDSIRLPKELKLTEPQEVDSPIRQGLCDASPDVDAIFRLVMGETFEWSPCKRRNVALDRGSWCPFNSQNTLWWRDAFALLYLPSYCNFRMTDIWRSFVAQRIAWENGWRISFHAATVYQERNPHDLMDDFAQEVPGYLHNRAIGDKLMALPIKSGKECIKENMLMAYEELVRAKILELAEFSLLNAWFRDIRDL
jgi:hypothetical protein